MKTKTSRKLDSHTNWYRAKVALWFIAEFVNHWDKDIQWISEKSTKDYQLQDLLEYIWSIVSKERKEDTL